MPQESTPIVTVKGTEIAYQRTGNGAPLVMLNGFAATSADWDPAFVGRLASSNELILLNNRGIGGSFDDGHPFDIENLADDCAQAVEILGLDRLSLIGWSMGGFIAQTFAVNHPDRVNKLVLLSTDAGGIDADVASPQVWSELFDCSGTPNEQARRLLFLLFPNDVAETFYRQFGNIVATARARLSVDVLNRQAAAVDAWHRKGLVEQLREINAPTLIATGTEDIVIPPSNALKLVNTIRGAWLAQFPHGGHAFMAQYPRSLADLINAFLRTGDAA
jgi:pimeloyl-ACP methyl ester carboxylesterase